MHRNKLNANYLTLFFIILIFGVPILAAIELYHFGHKSGIKLSHINQGDLLQPPLKTQEWQLVSLEPGQILKEKLLGRWTLLYVSALPCRQDCQQDLSKMRQIHSALGKDQQRVQRTWVILANDELTNFKAKRYSDLLLAVSTQNKLLRFFGDRVPIDQVQSSFFCIIDPLGNLLLIYPHAHAVAPRSIYKDLNRLLTISTIG